MNFYEKNQLSFKNWSHSIVEEINYNTNLNWHLVFDPCLIEDMPKIVDRLEPSAKYYPLYLNTYLDEAILYGPQILKLTPNSSLTKYLINNMEFNPFGALFIAETSQDDVVYEHLQNLFECLLEEGGSVLFRYFDPRQLYGIGTYSDPQFVKILIGPALKVIAWEPGRACKIEFNNFDKINDRFSANPDLLLPKKFTDHLWKECQIHAIIGAMKEQLKDIYFRLTKNQSLPLIYSFIEDINNKLFSYKFGNYNLLAASILIIKNGWDFWYKQDIQAVLKENYNNQKEIKIFLLSILKNNNY